MSSILKVHDNCQIPRWRVEKATIIRESDEKTFVVKLPDGSEEPIYKVHCYPISVKDLIAGRRERAEQNSKIGTNIRPKKKKKGK